MLGRLSWAAIPFNEPLPLLSGAVVGIVILAVLVVVTVKGWWPYLWREWLTSVDHKRIGVMYMVLGLVMLLRGFSDAIMMRTQQAIAVGDAQGYLPPQHYRPDLLGARHDHDLFRGDAARHRADELCRAVAARRARRRLPDAQFGQLLADRNGRAADQSCHSSSAISRARAGWAIRRSPSSLFRPMSASITTSGHCRSRASARLLTGINFVTTILKLRAPGMTYFRMPVFCWTALAANLLIVAAFPVLTATFVMLLLDRYLGHAFLHERCSAATR